MGAATASARDSRETDHAASARANRPARWGVPVSADARQQLLRQALEVVISRLPRLEYEVEQAERALERAQGELAAAHSAIAEMEAGLSPQRPPKP